MKKNFDIAIIGSGLTGLTTSLALSSLNYKIALIDPKSLIFKKNMYSDNRTTAISSGSVDFYKKIGVWKELNKYACPIRKILVEEVTSENRSSFGSANKKESPMGFMIENQYLLKILLALTKKNKKIVKYDYKLLDYNRTKEKVIVTLENNVSVHSKLIIGADGRNSFLRKLANIEVKYKNYNQKAFTFNVKHEKPHNNLAIEKFLEEGPLAMLPIVGNKKNNYSSVVWSCNYPNYFTFLDKGEKKVETLIQNYFEKIYGKIKIVSRIKTWDLSLTHAKKYTDHRLLLLGDSAHSIHPLAGQGFNLTLRGVQKLYTYAAEESNFNKDLGKKKYLLKYSKRHFLDATLLILVTDRLNFLFSNSNFILRKFRRKGLYLFSKSNFTNKLFKNYATKGALFSLKNF
ncbi:MAG: 2-octaprenyl-6-methoxyphenol hydroxylase [Alphaproteobacteria bacterium MarineAlpha9_Bin4]|nr:hypothetical protein [Pelagibacterales bacterium]PPR26822.1 MAG: 2-octaprenyl-6-methoxyphenol hydroxylase [Alphaproteobacteria bacterium MarineAlpha9_Bin4]